MNLKQLRRAKLARPTTYVDAPELAAWGVFAEGEKQQIKLRGLTANDLFTVREQIAKGSPLLALYKAANGNGDASGLTEAFKGLLGTDPKSIAYETRYRQELLVKAAINEDGSPAFDHQDVAVLAEHFPDLFVRLTEKIIKFCGEASTDLGEKLRNSGETKALEPPAPLESASDSSSTKPDPISSPSAA